MIRQLSHSSRAALFRSRSFLPSSSAPRLFSSTSPRSDEAKPPFEILLMGGDSFSLKVFRQLYQAKDLWSHIYVTTSVDRLIGTGHRELSRPPLRPWAENSGIPTSTAGPDTLRKYQLPEPFNQSSSSASRLLIAASFPYLIPRRILDMFPPMHTLNVHPSLLPRYRGAAPIQHAIMHGDEVTGVTVQTLSAGKFDHGEILGQEKVSLPDRVAYAEAADLLADKSASLLLDVLRDFENRKTNARTQDKITADEGVEPVLASKIRRTDAEIDFSTWTAVHAERQYRAFGHQRAIRGRLRGNGKAVNLRQVNLVHDHLQPAISEQLRVSEPGTLLFEDSTGRLLLRLCSPKGVDSLEDAVLEVKEIQTEGKRAGPAEMWWNGYGRRKGVRYLDTLT